MYCTSKRSSVKLFSWALCNEASFACKLVFSKFSAFYYRTELVFPNFRTIFLKKVRFMLKDANLTTRVSIRGFHGKIYFFSDLYMFLESQNPFRHLSLFSILHTQSRTFVVLHIYVRFKRRLVHI